MATVDDEVKVAEAEAGDTVGDLVDIANLGAGRDAFSATGAESSLKVHIRIQMRNGRKSITSVAGLDDDLDLKKILRAFKKNFSCNGALVRDKETKKEVIQVQGDQRSNIKDFLVDQEIVTADRVVVHGF